MTVDFSKLIKTKNTGPARTGRSLNILFGTSEIAPFSKTGGLADVAASLPKALAQRGHNVAVVTPLYKHLDPEKMCLSRRLTTLEVPLKAKSQKKVTATVWETRLSEGVTLFFIDYPPFFHRDGLYGYDDQSFDDNAGRFAFFSRALVEFARQFSVPVDVLHCNDWHTALAPVYLRHYYSKELNISSVLTVHNVAYQGEFPASDFESATGLPAKTFLTAAQLKTGNTFNMLKGGLVNADKVVTVSPTYAEEITTEEFGCGLEDLFKKRKKDLLGVLNGADYSIWSPENDMYLSIRFSEETLNGKRRNKAKLQHDFRLPVRPTLPLIAFVGRLTEQKGLDILIPAIRKLLKDVTDERSGFQCVILGEGDKKYESAITKLSKEFPNRVGAFVGYSEEKAHEIIGGADILMVPSRFEPCGLTQIYAMKYGTIPVVHRVGGLADTVTDVDQSPEDGTGFVFDSYTKSALWNTIDRAVERYRHHRQWRPLMMRAMQQDFSWNTSAESYESVYYQSL